MSEERLNRLEALMEQLIGMVATVISEQQEMRADMNKMKADIDGMKADINVMKAEIIEVKTDMRSMNERLERLEHMQTANSESMTYLKHKVSEHDHDIYILKERLSNDKIE